jgi:hypothetical protein
MFALANQGYQDGQLSDARVFATARGLVAKLVAMAVVKPNKRRAAALITRRLQVQILQGQPICGYSFRAPRIQWLHRSGAVGGEVASEQREDGQHGRDSDAWAHPRISLRTAVCA